MPDRPASSRALHSFSALTTRAGAAIVVAVLVCATWVAVMASGFDSGIQLVFATACSGITVIMVFVIQHTQQRAQRATQLKLDELIRSLPQADNKAVKLEASSDAELSELEDIAVAHHHAQRADDPLPEPVSSS